MKKVIGLLSSLLLCFGLSSAQTTLQTGDMAVVTFNSDGTDAFGLLTFVDLLPGTTILLTDNGFERGAASGAYTWGNTEEVVRLTVNTSTVPAGTVIQVTGGTIIPSNITQAPGEPSSTFMDQFTSSGDGLFILQGTWNNGNAGLLDATFSGTYIWGFNSRAWISAAATASGTAASRLPAELNCANTDFAIHSDNMQYLNTAPKTGTKPDIIAALGNLSNWQTSSSVTFPVTTGPFTITPGTSTATWTGAVDTDWFNCANWDIFQVPDFTTNVIFPTTTALNDCILQIGDSARCNDLTFTEAGGFTLRGEGSPAKVLEVNGDLTINTTPNGTCLSFDDGNGLTDDGHIYLYGDWTNNSDDSEFEETGSTIFFVGTGAQNVSIALPLTLEEFGSFVVNKPSGDLNLLDNIEIDDTLNLIQGRVVTGANIIRTSNPEPGIVIGNPLLSWIFGNLERETLAAGGMFNFPVGDALQAQVAVVDLAAGHGIVNLLASFSNAIPGAQPNINENGVLYNQMLNGGIWTIAPTQGALANNYNLHLYERGYTNGGGQYINVKRPGSAVAWANEGTHNTYFEGGGTVYCARNGLNAFSEFGIATTVLPVILNYFQGEVIEQNEVKLDWEIAAELNVSEYIVQRVEANGYPEIGRLEAEGPQQYTLYDLAPLTGRNEYRLMELTTNGEMIEVSRTEVYLDGIGNQWSLYPNPFQTDIQLLTNEPGLELNIVLSSIDGRVLFQSHGNSETLNGRLGTFTSQLPGGVYLISIHDGKQRTVEKIIKQ